MYRIVWSENQMLETIFIDYKRWIKENKNCVRHRMAERKQQSIISRDKRNSLGNRVKFMGCYSLVGSIEGKQLTS